MWEFLKALVFIGLCLWGIVSCQNSEWNRKIEANNLARERAERTPHVISRADGCSVYTFREGGAYHYFTRCANQTVTDSPHTEHCGKNCRKTVWESVPTANTKD